MPVMSQSRPFPRLLAAALRYLALLAGCALLPLAAACFVLACRVYIQSGPFAPSYVIVTLIAAVLGLLALRLARLFR
jgi:hypothetical protein